LAEEQKKSKNQLKGLALFIFLISAAAIIIGAALLVLVTA